VLSQARKSVNYAETDDEDDDVDVLQPLNSNKLQRRPSKRRKLSLEDSDDEFGIDEATEAALDEVGMCFVSNLSYHDINTESRPG
jgi:DNA mismatch repair protein MSH6